ncbi:TIGR04197 family type VII secretion effector [Enterococcus sp. AZ192]|uniref:TIGR04197 family type VII secretion effector n=1 Tax=unclassified Enterococcus TaxID=2608891 RepID=UPI003D26B45D
MEPISSNSAVAGELARGIFSAIDDLNSQQSIVTDEQSTISGNTAAKNAIKELQSMVQTISAAIATDANNIKSVAAEFDEADATIRKMMRGLR